MPVNAHGQPVGEDVPDWKPARRPGAESLIGRDVRLEPIDLDRHGEALFKAIVDPRDDATWTYLSYGPFADADSFLDWARAFMADDDPLFYVWIVDGKPCGFSSFMRVVPEHGNIEIGHVLLAPRLRRTRAATEGFALMMRAAFDLGNRRLEWKCDALNAPSWSAAERLGFRFEGVFENHLIYKGRNRDTAWFAITDREWPAVRVRLERWLDPGNFDDEGRQRRALER